MLNADGTQPQVVEFITDGPAAMIVLSNGMRYQLFAHGDHAHVMLELGKVPFDGNGGLALPFPSADDMDEALDDLIAAVNHGPGTDD